MMVLALLAYALDYIVFLVVNIELYFSELP